MTAAEQLTAAEMEILAFERTPWKYLARKEAAVMERFGLSSTRYFQRLQAILARPAAEAYDPELVRRLRRIQDARRAHRTAPAATDLRGAQ